MDDLAGKHALVTGGGTGVGAAIALALARAGATVTIAGRRQEPLERTAQEHARLRWVIGDVTDAQSVRSMLAEASAAQGPVEIVVANAGAATSKPFLKMDAGDLQAMIDVNLAGTFNVWQAALQPMLDAGWGRLIAIASTAGLKGYAYVSGYCAAKHGVVGLARALALETAKTGVTVNAICPGYTETPMLEQTIANIMRKTGRSRVEAEAPLKAQNPQGRFIQPEEVADAVLWLCGTGAASVTGQAISVSGGEI
jgi:Dehydrogenases with different specificities (related to short-chain alcohol dehydrogenases)